MKGFEWLGYLGYQTPVVTIPSKRSLSELRKEFLKNFGNDKAFRLQHNSDGSIVSVVSFFDGHGKSYFYCSLIGAGKGSFVKGQFMWQSLSRIGAIGFMAISAFIGITMLLNFGKLEGGPSMLWIPAGLLVVSFIMNNMMVAIGNSDRALILNRMKEVVRKQK